MRCFAIYKQKNTLKVWQCHNKYVLLQPLTSKRDLAQLVAHASGGREVAGSSPVIPTQEQKVGIGKCHPTFFINIPKPLQKQLSINIQ